MGEQTGKILVICFIATMYSSGMGMVVGTIGTWSTNLKKRHDRSPDYGLFFCGGSDDQRSEGGHRKYVPVINRFNPGALITDAFYSVLVYQDMEKYQRSLFLLTLFGSCFLGLRFCQ